jgi:hypothetical protein
MASGDIPAGFWRGQYLAGMYPAQHEEPEILR